LALFLLGCGPDFDPPSELHSLRVLAVQKDVPYAQPGDTVNLQMLWDDASPARGRHVQIAWSNPCVDPPGDLYYACFGNPSTFGGMLTLDSDTTHFTMPADVISRRPPADASKNAPYGIAYVFFTACAGTLDLAADLSGVVLPIVCKDAAGKLLGSDDFVAGYTSIYSFKDFSNHNPVISGFEFNGKALAASDSCRDDACQAIAGATAPVDLDCEDPAQAVRCVPTCSDDGDPKCTGYKLRPVIDKTDPANQDEDDVSAKLLGRHVGEQMWINYYTDAGGFKSPVRLLNDATAGWNDDFGTEFYAPKAPGLARVWAIAHDNRGGVAWTGITLKVQ
jgi:hypothetical protein